jgi:hypothetical protein
VIQFCYGIHCCCRRCIAWSNLSPWILQKVGINITCQAKEDVQSNEQVATDTLPHVYRKYCYVWIIMTPNRIVLQLWMLWTIWGLIFTQYQNSRWLDMYTGLRCWMHFIYVNAVLCVTFSRFSGVDHWDGWKYLCNSAWIWLYYVSNVVLFLHISFYFMFRIVVYSRKGSISLHVLVKSEDIDPGFVHKVISFDILQQQQWHYHIKTHSQSAYWSILWGNMSCLQLLHNLQIHRTNWLTVCYLM